MNTRKLIFAAAAALILFGVFSPPLKMDACSIDVGPAFIIRTRPDFPVKNYLAGQLGVIQPTYYRMYLVVAYRYLSGAPLTSTERKILHDAWEPERKSEEEIVRAGAHVDPVTLWLNARKTILGDSPAQRLWEMDGLGVATWRKFGDSNINFYNCLPDSFNAAVIRLRTYIDQFGATSSEAQEWARAQDQVFENCAPNPMYGHQGPVIPSEEPADAAQMMRADRQYQIAAANFYAGNFADAKRQFDQIAADGNSPWRGIAPLLAGRAVLREATINDGKEGTDDEGLADAEAIFRRVVADPSRTEYRAAAQRLVNFAEVRLHPDDELKRLASKLSKEDGEFNQDLTDYTALMDRVPYKEKQNSARDDMTDWIFSFQAGDASIHAHAVAKWKETGSNAWFATALATANAKSDAIEELLAAARKVKSDSPLYSLATFHRLRLEYDSGQRASARPEINALLKDNGKFPPSTINLLKALRMRMATELGDFLTYAPRQATATEIDGAPEPWDPKEFWRGEQQSDVMFDQDGAYVINRMLPLSMLTRAAEDASVPKALRPQLAIAAWARAVILADEARASAMARLCEELAPEMKPALEDTEGAPVGEARKYAAVFLMLHFPGVQIEVRSGSFRANHESEIDSFRDNWWGAETESPNYYGAKPGTIGNGSPLTSVYPDQKIHPADFLSADEVAAAESEWKKVSAGPAPNYFGSVVLNWAKQHSDDVHLPEALHLVVRATRYGNGNKETGAISKAAFELLHRKFPESEWAKRTPYWFNN
ncbi:MAG TPA: hypothetical protein VFO34_12015 [Candidatus Acidoferrales bacterium]|nr:hypothetical protein [Candidatus Acidoferrales bacterium]